MAVLLLIDNYDSFVHNLARYFERLGQTTLVVRNDAIDVEGVRKAGAEAVVLSPGPCTPHEAGVSLEMVRSLYRELPILGVCLGHQVIAEAFGATVGRAPLPVHGQASTLRHNDSGLFTGIPQPLKVGRYHSLIVEPSTLPSELLPTAWTDDRILMAFEHTTLPVYGVQFHPESILTEHGYEILANFLQRAKLSARNPTVTQSLVELEQPPAAAAVLPSGPVTF
ncbi:MAG TPA: aminodeoxychorismate/anthranilate synthase component II [Lacipirellulaceae bacterium]|nr:aminodeoxychorismate/anthranilate synthase component II [Lacipirellulaceae bacterium]